MALFYSPPTRWFVRHLGRQVFLLWLLWLATPAPANAIATSCEVSVVSLFAPGITALSPSSAAAGSGGVSVAVAGTSFTASSVVLWAGSPRSTTYVQSTQLLVQLTAADAATPGSYPVAVSDGGQTSAPINFIVTKAYYAKPTGSLDALATFGSNPDGSGAAPPSFSELGQVLYVGGSARQPSSNWTVSGAASKVVLLAGSTLLIPTGANFTGLLDLGPATVLEVSTVSATPGVSFGALDPTSTVVFRQQADFTVPAPPAPGYGNLVLMNQAKTLAGNVTVQGNLQLLDVQNFGGDFLQLGGNLTLSGAVTFDPTRLLTLTTTNLSAVQTLTGGGTALRLLRLLTAAGTPGVALAAGTNLELGGPAGGGYSLSAGSTLNVGSNTLRFVAGGQASIGAGTGQLALTPASQLVLVKSGPAALGVLRAAPNANVLGSLTIEATGGSSSTDNDLTLGTALDVRGTLALRSGQLSLGGNTLTLAGPVALGATGPAQLNGSATANLVFGGTGSIGPLSFAPGAGSTLRNLTLARTDTGSARVNATLTVLGTLTLTRGRLRFPAGYQVVLPPGATWAGGSSESFVNVMMQSAVTSGAVPRVALDFPLGNGLQNYRPVTVAVTATPGTTTYSVRQMERRPPTRTMPSALKWVSSVRYYTVEPGAGGTSTIQRGEISITFGSDDGVVNPRALRIARTSLVDPTLWEDLNGNFLAPSTTTTPIQQFTTGGDFVLATNSAVNPLPVTLTSFTAERRTNGSVLARWHTASELNSEYFELERSLDGRAFSSLGQVKAQGTSTVPHDYQQPDPLAPSQLLYYRLRLVDVGGQTTYSPVAVVAARSADEQLVVYPNPASSTLTVQLPPAAAGQPWRVYDTLGRPVALPASPTTEAVELDVHSLAAGTYFVQVGTGSNRLLRRFEKL